MDTTCTEVWNEHSYKGMLLTFKKLQEKQTPLLVAACVGNLDIVRMLLSHHAAIDQQDSVSTSFSTVTTCIYSCQIAFL